MAASFNTGFIQPSLVKQLQNILQQYPDDGQIIKELIQNAEDAGASTVKFLIDHTEYGSKTVVNKQLGLQQGPALFVYNDAVFTDDDWEGIRMIQDSVKTKDPLKVGRFGLGFKSVFHMTDLPGIVSGKQVGFLDPQEDYLIQEERSVTGDVLSSKASTRAWKLSAKLLQTNPDQFKPFLHDIFELNEHNFSSQNYSGTVFRFPLRLRAKSKISRTIYTIDKVRKLFEHFEQDAHLLLLFLKCVHTIEVHEKVPRQKTKLLHRVTIDQQILRQVVTERNNFVKSIRNIHGNAPITCSYKMRTVTNKNNTRDWLLTQVYDPKVLLDQKDSDERKMMPLVGVGLPLSGPHSPSGHTFCTLPMPLTEDNKTGLGVHVNGYFAVDQNRRHLKWPEADISASTATQSRSPADPQQSDEHWNSRLQQHSLPLAMLKLINFAIDCNTQAPKTISSSQIYRIFPDKKMVHENWRLVVEPFWEQLVKGQDACLLSSLNSWICPGDAYWIQQDEKYMGVLAKIVTAAQLPLVQPPAYIHNELTQRQVGHVVTPELISAILKTDILVPDEKINMVDYLFHGGRCRLLLGKELLPTEAHGYIDFSDKYRPLYLETPECRKSLLPEVGRKEILVNLSHTDSYYRLFQQIARAGGTQVHLLTSQHIPGLLRDLFARVEQPHYFGFSWLKKLWHYILSRGDVHLYEDLPIVACTDCHWDTLNKHEPYVEAFKNKSRGAKLDNCILQKMGLKVVLGMKKIVSIECQWQTQEYISPASITGMLDAMIKLGKETTTAAFRSLSEDERMTLLSFISEACNEGSEVLQWEHENFLTSLPLLLCYEVRNESDLWESASTKRVKCCADIDLPVPLPIKVARKRESSCIVRIANIPSLSDTAVLTDYVFPIINSYTPSQIQAIMKTVVSDIDHHMNNFPNFKQLVRKIPFIDLEGDFVSPDTVLNPLDISLRKMFGGVKVFPMGTFAEEYFILKLQGCFQQVTERMLVMLAEFINRNHSNKRLMKKQGTLLLQYMETHVERISQETCNALKVLKWVPVKNFKPKVYPQGVPWFGEKEPLSAPEAVGFIEHEYIIGSIKPITDCNLNENLKEKLGFNLLPSLDEVARHLHNIVKHFKAGQSSLIAILKEVYGFLAGQEASRVKESLLKNNCEEWIWAGERFRDIHQVTIEDTAVQMEPYVFQIPEEFSEWVSLFIDQGVQRNVSMQRVLLQAKTYHDTFQATKEECKRDLFVCLNILRSLKDSDFQTVQGSLVDLPVPVNSDGDTLKLVEAKNCTFCTENEGDPEEGLSIVHKNVTIDIVKALKIPNRRTRYLDPQELDNFGQSEPLTRRIHGLLEDYKDGVAVLKELIQNADDAGATEVHFMYDSRDFTKSSRSLIDPNMKALQGPALLCFNNERFSEEDFTNIVKLGGATKEKKVDQIGKFGLGFNAVYNLTDVPSFISGDDIVFFDPHVKYLEHVLKSHSKPGIRMNLKTHKEQICQFKDQFKVFHGILGCDLQNRQQLPTFQGTLFRFPLRTKKQAITSEISDIHYNRDTVLDLFKVLQRNADHLLLFVQNVRKVKISEITASGELQPCGVIQKKPVIVLRPMQRGTQKTEVGDGGFEEWKILKSVNRCRNTNDIHNSYIIGISTNFNGNLFRENSCSNETWLVTNFVKAQADGFEKESFLPVGSTGISLKTLQDKFSPRKLTNKKRNGGQAFCFLPLPIETTFPFHINGYFAVTSSRQQLKSQDINDIKSDKNAQWNQWLMENVVVKALVQGLKDLTSDRRLFDTTADCLFQLFPVSADVADNLVVSLCKSFYKLLVEDDSLAILPSPSGVWINFASSQFLDEELRFMTKNKEVVEVMVTVCQRHLTNSFVDFPQKIINAMNKLGLAGTLDCNKIQLAGFFQDIFLKHMANVSTTERDILLYFALLHCDGTLNEMLMQTPCVPILGLEGHLKPGQLVDPTGPLNKLYSKDESPFPVWLTPAYSRRLTDFKREELNQSLRRLGMRWDDISMPEVIERTKTVSRQARAVGVARSVILLDLLSRKLEKRPQEFNELTKYELQHIAFLPVKENPREWVYPWKSGSRFISAADSFTEEDMYLAGCSQYIAEFPGGSRHLKYILNGNKDVCFEKILEQIRCVSHRHGASQSELLSKIMYRIYSFLDAKAKDCKEAVYDIFAGVELIKVSDGNFVKPDKCALCLKSNLAPFLYEIPPQFQEHKDLVSALKIVKQFSVPVLVNVLKRMHVQFLDRKLDRKNLNIATDIANLLERSRGRLSVEEIFLPDSDGIMAKTDELCYNDCEWLDDKNERILYKWISHPVAIALGVMDIRRKTLGDHECGIPFGQSEKLTNRIKGILDSYPCGSEILKEILQNADDAQANQVYFILDHRTHSSKRTFHDRWSLLQGPALLVYNNKPFTEKDIEGIKNLGEGSKEHDPVTTGKYGVGFNCVYHVTETPMLLTPDGHGDHTLIAFDPHCKYVKGSTTSEPGKMYKNCKVLAHRFPDVFQCFDLPQLQQLDLSNGTLFRLPFRTWQMARHSLIKEKGFTIDDCQELFKEFSVNMKKYLLFLKSVKEIAMLEITKHNKVLKIDHVTSEPVSGSKDSEIFVQQMRACSEKVKSGELDSLPNYTCKYETDIIDARGYKERWLTVKQIGFRDPETFTDDLKAKFRRKKASLIPQGGVALQLHPLFNESDEGKFFCLLPLSISTCIPAHINGTFLLDHESRRNLWLAEKGSQSFKVLWNKAILAGIVAESYVDVVEEIASLHVDETMSYKDVCSFLNKVVSLFPNFSEKDEYLSGLEESVYAAIVRRNVKILPVISYTNIWSKLRTKYPNNGQVHIKWFHVCGLNNATAFWDKNLTFQNVITHILRNSNFPLVFLESDVKDKLAKFTETLQCITPKDILQHYLGNTHSEYKLTCPKHIGETPFADNDGLSSLLTFCRDALHEHLEGLPMLLMQDELIHKFSSKKDQTLISSYHTLVPRRKDLFANTLYLQFMNVHNLDKYLKHMCLNDLGKLMEYALPGEMCAEGIVPFDSSLCQWINDFWRFVKISASHLNDEHMGDLKSRIQQSFTTWCILPVNIHGKSYYARPSYLDLVVDILSSRPSTSSEKLVRIFEKLDYPQPLFKLPITNKTAWQFSSYGLADKIFVTLDQPHKVVLSIGKAIQLKLVDFDHLCISECHTIAVYFNDAISVEHNPLPQTREVRETLLRIPVYITVYDEQVSIECPSRVFIVPDEVKRDGINKWCYQTAGNIYLKHQNDVKKLHEMLGFHCLDFVSMYTEHILCFFHFFNEEERFTHLKEMKRFVEDSNVETSHQVRRLLAKLKSTPVLEDEAGILHCVNFFFSPHNELFEEMESAFPKKKFHGTDWIDFLEQIGLNYKPNEDQVVSYALKIEKMSQSPRTKESCAKKCKILLEAIFQDDNNLLPALKKIVDVRFIPESKPTDNFANLLPVKQQNQASFICFKGSVVHKWGKVCWTQIPVLPYFAFPQKINQWSCLGVTQEPSVAVVIENMKTVCLAYQDGVPKGKCPLMKEFLEVTFDNLKGRYETKDSISTIRHLDCIPVEDSSRLVKPVQIVLQDLPEEIPPYLYKLPQNTRIDSSLLLDIGGSEKVTIEQYLFVLEVIWKSSAGEPLGPNELKACEIALFELFERMYKEKRLVTKLYLLSGASHLSQLCLLQSKEVVFNDKPRWKGRVTQLQLRYMADVKRVKIQRVEKVFRLLPESIQPQFLSNIVTERCQDTGDALKSQRCKDLEERLTSEKFHNGIIRIMHHNDGDSMENAEGNDDDDDSIRELTESLERVKLYEVAQLVTSLHHGEIEVPGSERSCPSFVEKKADEIVIYLSGTCCSDTKFDHEIFTIINELMQHKLHGRSLFVTAIMKCDIDKIEEELNDFEVGLYETSSHKGPASRMPVLGSYIPLEFHHLLQQLSMRPLRKDEYVGYELHDPLDDCSEEREGEGQNSEDPVFIYAKVSEVIIPDGISSYVGYRYKIQIGRDEYLEVPYAKLYCFTRTVHKSETLEDNSDTHIEHTEYEDDITKIKEEIRSILKEAWKLEESVKKKIVKRLWLKWHPDKNLGKEELCNEVFKYITWVCDRLEQDLSVDLDETDGSSQPKKQKFQHSQGNFWSSFNFDGYARRARSHRQYENDYEKNYSSHSYGTPPSYHRKNPQPAEARRWMRQAQHDFNAASTDSSSASNYEWACFKYHQAAEKALKATIFVVNADIRPRQHNLTSLCFEVDNCSSLARQLENLLSGSANMRYPDHHSGGRIPHDVYTETHASRAAEMTQDILTRCRQFINNPI